MSAIIVTSDFHTYRPVMIARQLGNAANGIPAEIPSIFGVRTRYVLREIPAILRCGAALNVLLEKTTLHWVVFMV